MVIHAFSNPGAAIKLLLVNSNSTQAVSDRMVAVARTVAAPQTIITGITAPGHKVIRSHFEFTAAAVQTVAALKAHAPGHDAAIIGCFGDPGLKAARHELCIPVVGIAEAAMLTAHLLGGYYSIVTFGRHNAMGITDLARHYGLHTRLASVRIADISYGTILADPDQASPPAKPPPRRPTDGHDPKPRARNSGRTSDRVCKKKAKVGYG
ncbi:MAG: aspartate/glutamate racemase family protein [Nodosilinea sp.]